MFVVSRIGHWNRWAISHLTESVPLYSGERANALLLYFCVRRSILGIHIISLRISNLFC